MIDESELDAYLLDANESTCAFAIVGRVGSDNNLLVSALSALASDGICRNYCGRIADD